MTARSSPRFVLKCPYSAGLKAQAADSASSPESNSSPKTHRFVRKGFYRRASDSRSIPRYFCQSCRRSFSSSALTSSYRQKKRKLNEPIRKLLCSGVSQRRIARLLGINRKTVVRKLVFLAAQARLQQQGFLDLRARSGHPLESLHFDEMETFERSKCLPLSIALAVEEGSRKILGFQVSEMPANGPLAAISRSKYGPRADERAQGAKALFSEIAPLIARTATITSDQNPKYPAWIRPHFPHVTHRAVKGRRGCIVGQGELKKIGLDPLFSLNHTAAMIRANVNRLFRRTWCTTKRRDRLVDHLALYVQYHNEELT